RAPVLRMLVHERPAETPEACAGEVGDAAPGRLRTARYEPETWRIAPSPSRHRLDKPDDRMNALVPSFFRNPDDATPRLGAQHGSAIGCDAAAGGPPRAQPLREPFAAGSADDQPSTVERPDTPTLRPFPLQ